MQFYSFKAVGSSWILSRKMKGFFLFPFVMSFYWDDPKLAPAGTLVPEKAIAVLLPF